ncbi:MAG: hypothetical protein K6A40_00560 [Solobacterium sp.]|nr:hypothetical protein [Solobacterium sp.]
MDTERAKAVFAELEKHLKAQQSRYLNTQIWNAGDAVRCLEQAASEEEKEEIVRQYYRYLFPGGRGGLSDVVLWDDDLKTRIALNAPIVNAEKELQRIIEEADQTE